MAIIYKSNVANAKARLRAASLRALERCGSEAEGYAVDLCPTVTGRLQNSITHTVDSSLLAAYIGTNAEYAPYVEFGTGKYYPGGRPTPWVYEDAKGDKHWTAGNEAQPFIKPAVQGQRIRKRIFRHLFLFTQTSFPQELSFKFCIMADNGIICHKVY